MVLLRMQKPVGHFIRAVLLMPLYVPLFSPKAYSSATASHVYIIVLKVQAQPPYALPAEACLNKSVDTACLCEDAAPAVVCLSS